MLTDEVGKRCQYFIQHLIQHESQAAAVIVTMDTSLRTVPTNSKVFLRGLLNMREKHILTSVI